MEQILQYIILNLAGYAFFHFVWTLLPKPRPLDYTTIPGLKLPISSEVDLPELVVEPGRRVAKKADAGEDINQGHLGEIAKCGSFDRFLTRNQTLFGDLSSFWWGTRYVVVVSSEKFVRELRQYEEGMLALNPLAVGSILLGDQAFWTHVPARSFTTREHSAPSPALDSSVQSSLIERGPYRASSSIDAEPEEETEREQLQRVVPQYALGARTEGILRSLGRPLVVAFNKEIDIDAHPIPAFIPIILHTTAIISGWQLSDKQTILDKFSETLSFVPGMEDIASIGESF